MAKLNKKEVENRVKAGVAFLNVIKPKWFKKINLKKLDLSNGYTCIIGELEGEYSKGIEVFGISGAVAEKMGFHSAMDNWIDEDKEYSLLTSIWKKVITKLKRA